MKKKIDQTTWKRKQQFDFFSTFDSPFFNIVTKIDCTFMYNDSHENDYSFFLAYLYASLKAANSIDEFKYRIANNEVYRHESIQASSTIFNDDETFSFSYMPYFDKFADFYASAKEEIVRVKKEKPLVPSVNAEDVIHYSSLPWIDFSGIKHARHSGFGDSIPKIVFGKVTNENERKVMSVSLDVHHALMDGFHAGKFFTAFQDLMNQKLA